MLSLQAKQLELRPIRPSWPNWMANYAGSYPNFPRKTIWNGPAS